MQIIKKTIIIGSIFLSLQSCDFIKGKKGGEETSSSTSEEKLAPTPNFNADSAYFFVEKQVKFGPRVPNTSAHIKCGDWMIATLKKYGFEVIEQKFKPVTYDGKVLNARNIIGSYNPTASNRILLAAHWDSRPFADKDSVNKNTPIEAANDGGSGVGVLLEVARAIHATQTKPNIGVDIIFFDAEDWGEHQDYKGESKVPNSGYCLGSDYWSRNLHKANYTAYFGILLDMVGAKGATYYHEGSSLQFAQNVVQNVWAIGQRLGYQNYFISQEGGGLTDDHVPVNQNAKIPMIDIIDLKPYDNTFFQYHHTHGDTMEQIDKNSLKAVGQTLLQVLYQEASMAQ
jgi:glutaminyl-peptide cyclotransferase